MISSAKFAKLATFVTLFALVQDKALGAPGTLTHKSRYILDKRQAAGDDEDPGSRGRTQGCGSLKPQLPNVGALANQCVCFVNDRPVAAQSPAALQYSINLPVRYPQDTNVNGQCTFPPGGPITLLPRGTVGQGCCGYECTFGPCGEGDTLVCLEEGQQCQSGVPVAAPATRRELRGRECPAGYTSCAVAFTGGRQFYECLDVSKDLESCGGCMNPDVRFGNSTLSGKYGQDCSAIPNVAQVSCVQGECVIGACNRNFQLVDGECIQLD